MDAVELLQQLIRIPSLSGEEKAIAEFLKQSLDAFCDECWIDELNDVVGIIKGKKSGPVIMFNGHIDHADVGKMNEPYSGALMAGEAWNEPGQVVYGRGASDNKGAIAAMLSAAAELSTDRNFGGTLILTAVALEETGKGTGIKKVLQDLQGKNIKPDIVLSGECTNLDICLGHRGKVEFLLEVQGKTAHASNPSNGNNAILLMKEFIDRWGAVKLPRHPILGQCTSALSNISCKPGRPGIIPDLCYLNFDRRCLPGETVEAIEQEVLEVINEVSEKGTRFQFDLKVIQTAKPVLTSEDNPFVGCLAESIKKYAKEPDIRGWLFGTDANFIVNDFGIPTLGLGPGEEVYAHTPDDHVPVNHLEICKAIYKDFVENAAQGAVLKN